MPSISSRRLPGSESQITYVASIEGAVISPIRLCWLSLGQL